MAAFRVSFDLALAVYMLVLPFYDFVLKAASLGNTIVSHDVLQFTLYIIFHKINKTNYELF